MGDSIKWSNCVNGSSLLHRELPERVDFFDTLPTGNAARKNQRFLTALPTLAVPKENNRLEREFSLTAAP